LVSRSGPCTSIDGGERINLADGVTMRVVRWNHSGDSSNNPEQHDPVELTAAPTLDPVTWGLYAGVADAFPNGGGSRGFLFTVDGPQGRYSWFFQNSASASDLTVPIVVDGVSFGAPLDNLKAAMSDAGLTSVDLWIGTGGKPVAQLVVPVLNPKAYLPVHWDDMFGAFLLRAADVGRRRQPQRLRLHARRVLGGLVREPRRWLWWTPGLRLSDGHHVHGGAVRLRPRCRLGCGRSGGRWGERWNWRRQRSGRRCEWRGRRDGQRDGRDRRRGRCRERSRERRRI
jgi:hypothetical protein